MLADAKKMVLDVSLVTDGHVSIDYPRVSVSDFKMTIELVSASGTIGHRISRAYFFSFTQVDKMTKGNRPRN